MIKVNVYYFLIKYNIIFIQIYTIYHDNYNMVNMTHINENIVIHLTLILK